MSKFSRLVCLETLEISTGMGGGERQRWQGR